MNTESNIQPLFPDQEGTDLSRPVMIGEKVYFLQPAYQCGYWYASTSHPAENQRCPVWLPAPGLCPAHIEERRKRLLREAEELAAAAEMAAERLAAEKMLRRMLKVQWGLEEDEADELIRAMEETHE